MIEFYGMRKDAGNDEQWITINGAHIMVGGDGELKGQVGNKISSESAKGKTMKMSTTAKSTSQKTTSPKEGIVPGEKLIPEAKAGTNKEGDKIIDAIKDSTVDSKHAVNFQKAVANAPIGTKINLTQDEYTTETYEKVDGGWNYSYEIKMPGETQRETKKFSDEKVLSKIWPSVKRNPCKANKTDIWS